MRKMVEAPANSDPNPHKQELLQLAGAIKVLGKLDNLVPSPAEPPPPPRSERRHMWNTYDRRCEHNAEHLVRMITRGSEVNSSWGQLKAAALMRPLRRVLLRPIDAPWLLATGRLMGLDVTPIGADHHLMHFIIEVRSARRTARRTARRSPHRPCVALPCVSSLPVTRATLRFGTPSPSLRCAGSSRPSATSLARVRPHQGSRRRGGGAATACRRGSQASASQQARLIRVGRASLLRTRQAHLHS